MKPLHLFLLMLLTGLHPVVAADLPGRFFTTPEQRAMLDQLRYAPPEVAEPEPEPEPEPVMVEVEPEPPPPPPEVPGLRLDGYLKRSDGINTVWVNGVSSIDGDLDSFHVQPETRRIRDGKVRINIPVIEDSVTLKPGQIYQPGPRRLIDPATQEPEE